MSEASSVSTRSGAYTDPVDTLVDILAYFVAARNYSYVDILSNALDPLTAMEAIINALRDFETSCLKSGQRSEEEEVVCPKIKQEDLEKALRIAESQIREPGENLFHFTRKIAMRAFARAGKFRIKPVGGEEE